MGAEPDEERIDDKSHEEHGAEKHHEKLDVADEDFGAGRGEGVRNEAEDADGGEADHEADHELDALGGVIEHFARGDGAMAQHDAMAMAQARMPM